MALRPNPGWGPEAPHQSLPALLLTHQVRPRVGVEHPNPGLDCAVQGHAVQVSDGSVHQQQQAHHSH